MKVKITFRTINPAFNKEYARQYHLGNATEDNMKYLMDITGFTDQNITGYEKKENAIFKFETASIPDVTIFEIRTEAGAIQQFVISNKLIDRIHISDREKYNSSHIYIYFNNTNDFHNLFNQVFLAFEDCPDDLTEYILKHRQ